MITTDFTNHKGMNVIGLLWLFVNSSPIALMEQLKNVTVEMPHLDDVRFEVCAFRLINCPENNLCCFSCNLYFFHIFDNLLKMNDLRRQYANNMFL